MLRFVALACALLCAASGANAASCTQKVPDQSSTSGCYTYDLSALASAVFTVSDGQGHNYSASVCADVSATPAQCKNKPKAPGYQYDSKGCYVLGLLNETMTYPVDLQKSERGVRVVYSGGDLDRAMILDFFCDKDVDMMVQSVIEYPADTFRFLIYSSHACPASMSKTESCPFPKFENNWRSLAFRPIPTWFDDAKFGIFIHWGIFSVPSFKTEWYWRRLMEGEPDFVNFHNKNFGCSGVQPDKFPCTGPPFKYGDFAPMFKAEMYDPDAWAAMFKRAGAKYVVLTSKHHEGWCNFPSPQHWNWNSMDVGPVRDLVGNLTSSVRAQGLVMGLYHSLREWYNPLYIQDNDNNCSTTAFVDEILIPTLEDMVNKYQPDVIWADGAGDAPCTHDSVKYWKAPSFLSWLYNNGPNRNTVLVNSRWGTGAGGDYNTGHDRFSPGVLQPEKWESCYTIQKSSWGYDRTEALDHFWNSSNLIYQLVSSVACNGNLLLNVGPTHDGRILPIFEDRLTEMGDWLIINGEAIYNTTPYKVQFDTSKKHTWFTSPKLPSGRCNCTTAYAITFEWPDAGNDFVLTQIHSTTTTSVTLLGYSGAIKFTQKSDGLHIMPPVVSPSENPSSIAWVYKMTNLMA
ncbi:alpha-L-fucosidase-like isoform X1 [Oscarella lobularis]|uniref:alpha-L-fucosidase-like isoform X1 n=1 Tax=Oscarella lobularis TaxID=121494 RepID=UPI0033139574